jgi:hypothetical protein
MALPAYLNGTHRGPDLAVEGGHIDVDISNAFIGSLTVNTQSGATQLSHVR